MIAYYETQQSCRIANSDGYQHKIENDQMNRILYICLELHLYYLFIDKTKLRKSFVTTTYIRLKELIIIMLSLDNYLYQRNMNEHQKVKSIHLINF